jgi:NAD(P)-dependent dehydrogenase (short-subunit alcohol dehydrogenase family)
MARTDVGKLRAVVLGAETAAGRVVAAVLASAHLAVVAATSDAAAAFEVQRLGRQLQAPSQAIDATNEMATRVMMRQIVKELGGLDLLAFCADLGPATGPALTLAARFAAREMLRSGKSGTIVVAAAVTLAEPPPEGVRVVAVKPPPQPDAAWARSVLDSLP